MVIVSFYGLELKRKRHMQTCQSELGLWTGPPARQENDGSG